MSDLVRFGVSLEKTLLKKFDEIVGRRNFANRSEALRELIRRELVADVWERDGQAAGAITLVYNHHQGDLLHKLTDIQHHFQDVVISVQHIHLDHDNCLEILAVKGAVRKIHTLAEQLKSVRGVLHTTVNATGISGLQ